jgi:hypothetical protein
MQHGLLSNEHGRLDSGSENRNGNLCIPRGRIGIVVSRFFSPQTTCLSSMKYWSSFT